MCRHPTLIGCSFHSAFLTQRVNLYSKSESFEIQRHGDSRGGTWETEGKHMYQFCENSSGKPELRQYQHCRKQSNVVRIVTSPTFWNLYNVCQKKHFNLETTVCSSSWRLRFAYCPGTAKQKIKKKTNEPFWNFGELRKQKEDAFQKLEVRKYNSTNSQQ